LRRCPTAPEKTRPLASADEFRPWREGSERIAIFIDGSNLYHALEESCSRTDLDFAAFIQWIAGERSLFRTYYYNIIQDEKRRPTEFQQQQRFLQALHLIPYVETRFGTTRIRDGQVVEKGVDIMLATDLLYYAWQDYYDMAVLVSGDGDFAYAIQTLKNLGKYVQVVTFESNQSPDLWQKADLRTLLTPELLTQEDLWVNKEPVRKRRRRPTSGTTRRPTRNPEESTSNGRAEPVAAQ
jgi:uncharacterized LabA/DUF88 family protein